MLGFITCTFPDKAPICSIQKKEEKKKEKQKSFQTGYQSYRSSNIILNQSLIIMFIDACVLLLEGQVAFSHARLSKVCNASIVFLMGSVCRYELIVFL